MGGSAVHLGASLWWPFGEEGLARPLSRNTTRMGVRGAWAGTWTGQEASSALLGPQLHAARPERAQDLTVGSQRPEPRGFLEAQCCWG